MWSVLHTNERRETSNVARNWSRRSTITESTISDLLRCHPPWPGSWQFLDVWLSLHPCLCLWVYQWQCTPMSGCMAIIAHLFVGVSMTMHTYVWVYGYHFTPVCGCINDNAHPCLGVWLSLHPCLWVYQWQCTPMSGCMAITAPLFLFVGVSMTHTLSIAFRHLPPNSARFSYATEGALFISAQLSTDAVSALRKVRVLIRLWKQPSAQART